MTCPGLSSATDGTCSSFMVRMISPRRIAIARSTPARPPAISPYRYARPTSVNRAPNASEATMSAPFMIPVSSAISVRSPTAFTTEGSR